MAKTKGKLPSRTWLINNGHKELVKCMKKHPEMFAHIQQEKRGNSMPTEAIQG